MGWDAEKWSEGMTYEELKKQMGGGEGGEGGNVGVTSLSEELEKYERSYPYEDLIDPYRMLDGVDPCNKEVHLSDQDFIKYFKCTKEEFKGMKKWKKDSMKQKLKLF